MSSLLEKARIRSLEREGNSQDACEQMAELFRRFGELDRHSLGPELVRLQNLTCPGSMKRASALGRLQWWFFRSVHPILGRFLRAASLASPYQASYELAVYLQQQQLEFESGMRSEMALIRKKLEEIEQELRSSSVRR